MRVSIGSGYFANLISQHLRLPEKSSAFTAGLLHNIGRFVLLYNLPDAYEQLFKENNQYIPTPGDEVRMMGIDHSSIGALAAQHWNFPELISSLIESYHKPGQLTTDNHRTIALVLSASSDIAQQLCAKYDELKQTASESGETDVEGIDEELFPIQMEYPIALQQISDLKHVDIEELTLLIEGSQEEAIQYIDMMMNV